MAAKYEGNDLQAITRLSDLDAKIAQLNHDYTVLPQRAKLEEIKLCAGSVRTELREAEEGHRKLAVRVEDLDAQTAAITRRIHELESKLYGQPVPDAKDAHAMTSEIEHLREQLSGLENEEISTMERLEPAAQSAEEGRRRAAELAGEFKEAQEALSEAEDSLGAQIDQLEAERKELGGSVSAAVLAAYGQVHGKVADPVAHLRGSSCSGCHLTMSAAEVTQVKQTSQTEVVTCDECGRILVSD